MKIDIDFEIGDPIIRIEENQRDGHYFSYHGFRYQDIPDVGKKVFRTIREAEIAKARIEKEDQTRK